VTDQPKITVRRIEDPRRIARKGFGKSMMDSVLPQQPQQMPNTLRSRATARVMDVLSEGPVAGLHDGVTNGALIWHSVYLDDTPIQDEAGNFNFAIREGNQRYGTPGQSPVPGWPLSEASFGVGVEMKYLDPVVRDTNVPISAVRYVIRLPSLAHFENDGDVTDHHVTYAFDYRIDGGPWTNAVTETISGKSLSPFERQVRVQLPFTTGSLSIRTIRLTPEEASEFQSKTIFASYTEIVDGQIAYDDTALVSLTVDAEEFQSLPKRSFLLDGVCVEIPSNYNGRTHGYAGDWDGSFYVQWTNNPAWLLYAFLTNTRWGLGNYIDVNAIDKWSFYSAAVYNDGSVPDGEGGSEVRFTCNGVLNTRQDAFVVLQALASVMRCQLYYANGAIFLVQDRQLTVPERIFGPADVVDGIFEYQSSDFRSRYNAAAITWNDPDEKYEASVELVIDQVLVGQQGYKETQATAYACTSRGQAQRLGRWLIYTSQYETEIVSFRVSMENADVRPGMLINISDPSLAGVRLAGRLLDEDRSNYVRLDKLPDEMRANPTAWHIIFAIGTGADPHNRQRIYDMQVYSIDPANDAVQIQGKPEAFPEGSMWMAHAGAVEPMPFRVNSISDVGQGLYQIVATEYHVEKFEYVDYGVKVPPPSFSLIPIGPLLPPTDLKVTEYIYLDARGSPQFGVLLSWSASPDARVMRYQIEMSGPAGDYRRFGNVLGVLQDVQAMRQGEWLALVVAYDNLGRRSRPAALTFVPIGLSVKPLPPSALFITANGRTSTLIWLPTGEIDVVSYWIKWSPLESGATWARATTSIAQVDRNTTQIVTPTRSGTFMIKSIDALGQESESYASAVLVEQITENVHVLDILEQPDFGGNLGTNWHRSLGNLLLPPPEAAEAVPPGLFPGDRATALNQTPTRVDAYGFQDEFDLGLVSSVSMVAITEGYALFLGRVMATWTPLADADPLASGRSGAMAAWVPLASAVPLAYGSANSPNWDAHIEVRVSQDGVAFGGWTPLKSALITGRRFQWRMIGSVYDLETTLRIARCEVWMEVPLRNIQGSDVALDGTGHKTVTYATPFLATPTVQLTARQSLAPGGNIVITASTPDHFTVEHRNAAGAATAGGSIDYFVQGYGGGIPLAVAA